MKCSEDVAIHKKCVENERTYDFLASLKVECDAVRVQILGKPELPSLKEAISIVRAEEGRRGVKLEETGGKLCLIDSKGSWLGKDSKGGKEES